MSIPCLVRQPRKVESTTDKHNTAGRFSTGADSPDPSPKGDEFVSLIFSQRCFVETIAHEVVGFPWLSLTTLTGLSSGHNNCSARAIVLITRTSTTLMASCQPPLRARNAPGRMAPFPTSETWHGSLSLPSCKKVRKHLQPNGKFTSHIYMAMNHEKYLKGALKEAQRGRCWHNGKIPVMEVSPSIQSEQRFRRDTHQHAEKTRCRREFEAVCSILVLLESGVATGNASKRQGAVRRVYLLKRAVPIPPPYSEDIFSTAHVAA